MRTIVTNAVIVMLSGFKHFIDLSKERTATQSRGWLDRALLRTRITCAQDSEKKTESKFDGLLPQISIIHIHRYGSLRD